MSSGNFKISNENLNGAAKENVEERNSNGKSIEVFPCLQTTSLQEDILPRISGDPGMIGISAKENCDVIEKWT